MAVKANRLGPGTLKFGDVGSEKEFATGTTKTELTPSVSEEDDVTVLSGDILAGEEEESYVLSGEMYQDYESGLQSLIVWCKTNAGTELPFTFTPNTDIGAGALTVTGVVRIRSVKLGGDVKTRNTTEFSFKGIGDYAYAATV